MKVTAVCDQCLGKMRFDASKAPERLACGRCGREKPVSPTDAVRLENRLDQCPVCGSAYFYREKDFNSWAGGAVILAAVAGFLLMAERNIAIALGILLAAAGLDLVVYLVVPFRYNCYKCLASIRGAARNPSIGPYDLGTAGRFTDDYEDRNQARD